MADCRVGDDVPLEVKLTNRSKSVIGSFSLTVVHFQHYKNGVQNYDLQDAVSFISASTFYISTVNPTENSVCVSSYTPVISIRTSSSKMTGSVCPASTSKPRSQSNSEL
ncbi:trafficking protein particle complex subunit 9-like [Carassius gibelio]|uniref:trafficking protein particle complex subunit 9-like n=1 Tax=Carassius gibelio TaxID=101364 RepID=UPI0022792E04|nr:trafficking protein particle complex subunit 9-like [Carassius gibelio]